MLSMRTNYTQILQSKLTGEGKDIIDTSAVVSGDIFKFLGVSRVIISDTAYANIEGQPGMYNVTINCIQADLDLRKYEMLASTAMVDKAAAELAMSLLMGEKKVWPDGSSWDNYSTKLKEYNTILSKPSIWNKNAPPALGKSFLGTFMARVLKTFAKMDAT